MEMSMSKRTLMIVVIIAIIAAGALSYAFLFNRKDNKMNYVLMPVEVGDIQSIVVATGTLNPVTTVEVGSQVSGRIAKLNADFNSRVKKGEIVAELDQSLFLTRVKQSEANYKSSAAALEKAKVNFENARRSLDRIKDLFAKGFASPEEKDAAEEKFYSYQAEVKASEARLEQALAQLESNNVDLQHTIISSPIDGIVISRNVNVGQTVAASFQAPVLFEIANDLTKMQIDCNVDEADVGSIREGQRTTFTVDAFPDEVFQGKVVQVRFAPIIVQNVVTYDTIIEVHNTELKLKPGMTATVSIVVDERKGILKIPNAALRFTPDLSPEEISKLFKKATEQTAERREQMQDSPEGRARREGGFPMGEASQRPFMQGKKPPTVWILNEKKQLQPIFVVTGLNDANFTEIVRGGLTKNQEVITGMELASEQNGSGSALGSPFMPRRRRR
jgi:HlyD family secretion protein